MAHDYVNTGHCVDCYKTYQKEYRALNREQNKEYAKAYRARAKVAETSAAPLADRMTDECPLSEVSFAPTI